MCVCVAGGPLETKRNSDEPGCILGPMALSDRLHIYVFINAPVEKCFLSSNWKNALETTETTSHIRQRKGQPGFWPRLRHHLGPEIDSSFTLPSASTHQCCQHSPIFASVFSAYVRHFVGKNAQAPSSSEIQMSVHCTKCRAWGGNRYKLLVLLILSPNSKESLLNLRVRFFENPYSRRIFCWGAYNKNKIG